MKLQDIVSALIKSDNLDVSDADLVETAKRLVNAMVLPANVLSFGKWMKGVVNYEKD